MKFAARIFSFVFFFLFVSLLIIRPAFAQVQTRQNNPPASGLHTYTQNVMIEVASSISCLITGVDPVNPKAECLGINNGKIGPVDARGGAIGAMGNLITMTFTPPVHTGDYVKYLAGNFGISKPAYAANQPNGLGFAGLNSLFDLWTSFRNVAYLLFVLIFVIIGLAIMFRVHIDPRTVMSIENQIPKIIIGLIMVTFSIAIAGLLIDLMYLLIYLVIGIFSSVPNNTIDKAFYNMQGLNTIEVANNLPAKGLGDTTGILGITTSAAGSVSDILVKSLLSGPPGKLIAFALGSALGFGGAGVVQGVFPTLAKGAPTIASIAGAGICAATVAGAAASPICAVIAGTIAQVIAGAVTGTATAVFSDAFLGGIASIITFVIIGIAILFALFRLWFTLIQAYIFILMDIVLAPFWIIAGLVPGSSIGFGAWLRDLSANLLVFPATIGMFLLGEAFINSFKIGSNGTFAPPLLGNANTPNLFGSLIGLGIILITPNILTMIKAALKAPKMDMAAIGMAIGAGVGLPMNTFRQTGSIIMGRNEAIMNPETKEWERRGSLRTFFGGVLRR